MIPIAESFTCPQCHRTSFNPNDIKARYCGACHLFEDQMQDVSPEAAVRRKLRPFVDAISRSLADNGVFGPVQEATDLGDGTIRRVRIVIDKIEINDAAAVEKMLSDLGLAN